MELNDKVTQLEDEIKILKNEVQAVLLDLRESYLNNENPFNTAMQPMANQPIIINQPAPAPVPVPSEPPDVPEDVKEETRIPEPAVNEPETDTVVPEAEMVKEKEEPLEKLPDYQAESREELTGAVEMTDEPEMRAGEETGPEEGSRAWRPQIGNTAPFMSGGTNNGSGGKIDLDNIAGLAQWVEEAVIKLGPERTEAVLDISEMMGHVSQELKNILVKFIRPVPEGLTNKISTRDYLASLIELTGLLGKDNRSEVALLYILCQENDNR